MLPNTISYESHVAPYKENFKLSTISLEQITQIKDFVSIVLETKKKEQPHIVGSLKEEKRWYTGFAGEVALENFLGIKFTDFSVGNSENYNIPDMVKAGYNVGVKTVEYGKFPLIFKKSYKPEVIILKKNLSEFFICGLATLDVLDEMQSDSLIISPYLKARGTKTGFFGFQYLQQFSNLKEFEALMVKN